MPPYLHCPLCDLVCKGRESLAHHVTLHMPYSSRVGELGCWCGFFGSRNVLAEHLLDHGVVQHLAECAMERMGT